MTPILQCRSCLSTEFQTVLDLGNTPLANALLTEDQLNDSEKTYPLTVVFCPSCTLLQITETVSPEELFSHYFYFSSFSESFLQHCQKLAENIVKSRSLNSESLVIDIASNDGYLLQYYQQKGVPVVGIEPAENIATVANEKGVPTTCVFFSKNEAQAIVDQGQKADVIHANNVLPHVADQNDFVAGIEILLKQTGTAVIEFAYACDTIDRCEFDQIYHEHVCYFSLTSLKHLLERNNLEIWHVEHLPVHGGSLRVYAGHRGENTISNSVIKMLQKEERWGVHTIEPYKQFAEKTQHLKQSLLRILRDVTSEGKSVAAYGASAKGSTLMNYIGIGSDLVEYVVDRSTVKQGHYTPGTHLKIEPVEMLLERQPDYTLLLTWNFKEEILKQQEAYCRAGGKFIIPVPKPTIV